MRRRVVVTGIAGFSPIGNDWTSIRQALIAHRSGVRLTTEWNDVEGLQTRLGGWVEDFEVPADYPRKKVRTMGRVSTMATVATERALRSAGLLRAASLSDGSTGVAYGSTSGSPAALETFAGQVMLNRSLKGVSPNLYIQVMSHTAAANLAQFFELRGRVIPTCSACTSGSQGLGYAYEAIRFGRATCMLAGGAEELHMVDAAVFDVLFATSTAHSEPIRTPRPFDRARDGLVVAEGACTFVLEELQHAVARGAPIVAEILGFATNCDGEHMTQPDARGMEAVMRAALDDAQLCPADIDYVGAHATATEVGDIAESCATERVFGSKVPVSSLKGHMGHTLGACGALESWITIEMMREGWVAPTRNLEEVDPRCAPLDYVRGELRPLSGGTAMKNNFAFGGINTSLILRRWE